MTDIEKEKSKRVELMKIIQNIKDDPFQVAKYIQDIKESIPSKKELEDIRSMSIANSVLPSSLPVTTSFFNGRRAKNLNIVGATATQDGDTVNVVVPSSGSGVNLSPLTITGTQDGANLTFTLSENPDPDNSLMFYKNGQFLTQDIDYTLSGTTVTLVIAPDADDVLTAFAGVTVSGTLTPDTGQYKIFVTVGNADADYITDGVADDVEIQAAITAVAAAGGGAIFIKLGTYDITATITIPFDSKVRIMGEKMVRNTVAADGGTILKASTSLTNMFSVSGNTNPSTNADLSHDVRWEQIVFNGNSLVTNLVRLSNVDGPQFSNCRFINGTNSIVTVWDSVSDPTAATIPGGIFLDHCIISANSGIGIDLQYQTQCSFDTVWFTGTSVSTWVNIKSSTKIKFSNVEFNTATTAITLSDTATFQCADIVFDNSIFSIGTGNKAWADTRTHALSRRFYVNGSTFPGVTDYDAPPNSEYNSMLFALDLTNVIDRTTLNIQNITTATSDMVNLENNGLGNGLYIQQDGILGANKRAFYLQQVSDLTSSARQAMLLYTNTAHSGGYMLEIRDDNSTSALTAVQRIQADGTSTALRIDGTLSSSTSNIVDSRNAGTGNGLYILQSGVLASNKRGLFLEITSNLTGSDRQGALFYTNVANTAGYLVDLRDDNASSTLTGVLRMQIDGTPTNGGLYIDNNNNGRAINIDHDGNSGSTITGLQINTANAGAGVARGLWVEAGTTQLDGSLQCDSIVNDTGLAAGVYTPTRSAEANLDSNVTMSEAQYMRVGNTVTVSGRFTADPTLTTTATSFEFTLPIASNIGAVEDCAGVAFAGGIAGQGAAILGSVANNTAVVNWIAVDVTSQSWSYNFSYQVI